MKFSSIFKGFRLTRFSPRYSLPRTCSTPKRESALKVKNGGKYTVSCAFSAVFLLFNYKSIKNGSNSFSSLLLPFTTILIFLDCFRQFESVFKSICRPDCAAFQENNRLVLCPKFTKYKGNNIPILSQI